MLSITITIAILSIAFLVWIIVQNINKSKQTEFPLLFIMEGLGLLGSSGILGCLDFDFSLNIDTKFGAVLGHIKSPDTNNILFIPGIVLIILGITLQKSIKTRVYVLNMLGKVKHEISDVYTVNSLKLKDYQLKETVLDLRWATNEVNQNTWQKVKAQIEEYINEFSARSENSTLCFTGMAPIPFEAYAGTCMAGHSIKRFFEYKRNEDVYYELLQKTWFNSRGYLKNKKALVHNASRFSDDESTVTEAVLAVSITQTVRDSDLTQFNCLVVRLGIEEPKDNVINSIMRLRDYVDETIALIIKLKNIYPNLIRIHMASAVPSCYIFDFGCKLGHLDNRVPEIIVHHYVSTGTLKYKYGIVVTGENKGKLVINN